MNKIIKILLIFTIVIIVTSSGCTDINTQNTTDSNSSNKKIIVGVSILPQSEFVEQIGGDKVSTVIMIPPGASAHTYEPTPNQLKNLSNAKMYAKLGSNIEFELAWMDKFIAVNPNMEIVNTSTGIKFRTMKENHENEHADEHTSEYHTGIDTHVWTSPQNAKIMLTNIYDGFVKIDPQNQEYYKQNYDLYISKLDTVDAEIKNVLANKNGTSFMVYHPSWGYFADQYNLHEIAIESEGKEPSAQDLQNIINEAKSKNIKVIFVQKGFSTASANAIADQINGQVVELDPLDKNYIDNLYKVADAFEKGLA